VGLIDEAFYRSAVLFDDGTIYQLYRDVLGHAGGHGGEGGIGYSGGDGREGGDGGIGGAGGGAIEIVAQGGLICSTSELLARGGEGQTGQSGASGALPPVTTRDEGDGGDSGEQGSFSPGYSGGHGGAGGLGGRGGDGGAGGGGGGGAGGTIKLLGSNVIAAGATVNTSGGAGAGRDSVGNDDGGDGRFILGTNTNRASFDGTPIGTREEMDSGSGALNPFLPGNVVTPNIVGLGGRTEDNEQFWPGAEAFGLLGTDVPADELFSGDVLDPLASAVLVRVDRGPAGFNQDYVGYDMVLLANLGYKEEANAEPLDLVKPRLGVGSVLSPLWVGGWTTDPRFGGTGDEILDALKPYEVYATLVPEGDHTFQFSATMGDDLLFAKGELANGEVLYLNTLGKQVPVEQVLPPGGPTYGHRPWQRLATVAPRGGDIVVELSGAGAGTVAADAVRLVRPVLASLRHVDLRNNPLDNAAYEAVIPALRSERPGGFDALAEENLLFDANEAPVLEPIEPVFLSERGYALEFDGNDHVELPKDVLDDLTDVTLEFWLQTTEQVHHTIISAANDARHKDYGVNVVSELDYVRLFLKDPEGDGTRNYVTFSVPSSSYTDGNWHHFAIVRDAGNLEAILYLDAFQQGNPISFSETIAGALEVDRLALGRSFAPGGGFAAGDPLRGQLDEVRIWDKALTNEEIRASMGGGAAAGGHLVGHWSFDEAAGTTVDDRSGNGNTGTLGGGNVANMPRWTNKGVDSVAIDLGEQTAGWHATDMDFATKEDWSPEVLSAAGTVVETYHDGSFAGADWNEHPVLAGLFDPGGVSQNSAEGAPHAPCQDGRYKNRNEGGTPKDMAWGHINSEAGFAYNPATQGAIQNVEMSFQFYVYQVPDESFHGIEHGFLIRQGDNYYRAGSEITTWQYSHTVGWFTHHEAQLSAASFNWVAGPNPDSLPDFGRSGLPIRFGYFTANNTGYYNRWFGWYIDDFKVRVTHESPAVSAVQSLTGGSSGCYRQLTASYTQSITVGDIYTAAVYDPAQQGAIDAIDITYDFRTLEKATGSDPEIAPLLKQGATYYRLPLEHVPVINQWIREDCRGLTSNAFFRVKGPGPDEPVFTTDGDPIQFGYVVSTTADASSSAVIDRWGVDNFGVTIYSGISSLSYTPQSDDSQVDVQIGDGQLVVRPAPFVYEDGAFLEGDWEHDLTVTGGTGTFTVSQSTADGVAGVYQLGYYDWSGGPGSLRSVFVTGTYDTHTQGEIHAIDMEFDFRTITGPRDNETVQQSNNWPGFLVEQGGTYYYGPGRFVYKDDGWARVSFASYEATGFTAADGSHPDFSVKATNLIRFGYFVTTGTGGYMTPMTWGIDNFKVTVHTDERFEGTAQITVTAHDGPMFPRDHRGRTDTQTFNVHVGTGAIYGTKYHDLDKDGVQDLGETGLEGWRVSLDDARVVTSMGSLATANDVVVQPDGKVVAAGSVLVRYNADGTLDTDFDEDGIVSPPFEVRSVAIQNISEQDFRILVAGSFSGSDGCDFALARYNQDGTRDTTFDPVENDGMVTTSIAADSGDDYVESLAFQSDGKIVVVGYSYDATTKEDFALARYNPDGTLDDGGADDTDAGDKFGDFGWVTKNFENPDETDGRDFIYDLAIDTNDRIIVVGQTDIVPAYGDDEDFAVARFTEDGQFDTSFGGGLVTTDFDHDIGPGDAHRPDGAVGVLIQEDGQIVVVGESGAGSERNVALARYDQYGEPDTTFVGDDGVADGKVVTAISSNDSDSASDVLIQRVDGEDRIVVGGAVSYQPPLGRGDHEFVLARYGPDGRLDRSFGAGGSVITSFGAGNDIAYGVAIQPNGRIVLAGATNIWSDDVDIAVARYLENGSLDPTFDDGKLFGQPDPSTITDANGDYVFTDLVPGTYTVTEELQDGWTGSTRVVYSDGAFFEKDWKDVVLAVEDPQNVTRFTSYHEHSGGPGYGGPFQKGQYVYATYLSVGHVAAGLGSYDPSTRGPIEHLAFEFDFKNFASLSAVGLLIRQAGNHYILGCALGSPDWERVAWSWTSDEIQALVQTYAPPETPALDITAAGAPIQFGYFTANSDGNPDGTSEIPVWGIDNFTVTVNRDLSANFHTHSVSVGDIVTGVDFGNFQVVDAVQAGVTRQGQSVEPIQSAAGAVRVYEGDTIEVNANIFDPDVAAANPLFSWTAIAEAGKTFDLDSADQQAATFMPHDNGVFTVTVEVTAGGQTYQDSLTIVADNLPPVVDLGADREQDEGTEITLHAINDGLVNDPGGDDTHRYDWTVERLVNGQVVEDLTPEPNADPALLSFMPSDDGVFKISLTATDKTGRDTVQDCDVVVITVLNVRPTVDAGADETVTEGDAVNILSPFSDDSTDDTHTATIDWGDGTVETGTVSETDGSGTVSGSHAYADNGTYTVTVTVTDDDGEPASDTLEVTVTNRAPTLTAVSDQTVVEGATLSMPDLGTFTDPGFDNPDMPGGGTEETFTYTIDWGDGTAADTGDVTIDAAGSPGTLTAGSFDGSHVYADDGTYTATVRLADDDMSGDFVNGTAGVDFVQQTFLVTVNNIAPTLLVVSPQQVDEGATLSLVDLGTFKDPGFDNPVNPNQQPGGSEETFVYQINWGDETAVDTGNVTVDTPGSPGTLTVGSFDGSHIYGNNGTYTVTVKLADDDMSGDFVNGTVDVDFVQQTFAVTVNNVVPDVEIVFPDVWTFDFGTVTSPVRQDYVGVDKTTSYQADAGYGWTEGTGANLDEWDRDAPDDSLRRDLVEVTAAPATFAVDLPDGLYNVAVVMGDETTARTNMQLTFESGEAGQLVPDSVNKDAGEFHEETYSVHVSGGQLNMELTGLGTVINALSIAPPEGRQLELQATFSDPGDAVDEFDWEWSATGPRGVVVRTESGHMVTAGSVPKFPFTPDNNGRYLVQLTVSDGDDSGVAEQEIVVGNVDPAATGLGDGTAQANRPFLFDGTVVDPGADNWTGTVTIAKEEELGGAGILPAGPAGSPPHAAGDPGDPVTLPLIVDGEDKDFSGSFVFAEVGTYNVTVTIEDDEGYGTEEFEVQVTPAPGVILTETGGSTDVTEGGATDDTYTVQLAVSPKAGTQVTILITSGRQLGASPSSLTFDDSNWDQPQTVTVTAVDDDVVEGDHMGLITHSASSTDTEDEYHEIPVNPLTATVTDNEALADVLIQFTDEFGNTITDLYLGDTFRICVLAQDLRTAGSGQGVTAAFVDVTYDQTLIDITGITHLAPFNQVLLFDVDANFRIELDEGMLSAELRQAFEDAGFALSGNAVVTLVEPIEEWKIEDTDNGRRYTIRNSGPRLDVWNTEMPGTIDEAQGLVNEVGGGEILTRPINRSRQAVFYLDATATAPGELLVQTKQADDVAPGIRLDRMERDVGSSTNYGGDSIQIPTVEVEFELIDLDGTEGIAVDESFDVAVHFRDVRNPLDPQAVFSCYADLLFDPSMLQVDGITYDPDYPQDQRGTTDNQLGWIDEVGATGGITPATDTCVFTVHLTALGEGTTSITSKQADDANSKITVYGDNSDQRQTNTAFGALEIEVNTLAAEVLDRHIFYNNSYFDGDPSAGRDDDNAIALDPASASDPALGKTALLPGQTATFQNYTSYWRGINGIMVDIANLPDAEGLGAADFEFHVSNRNNRPANNADDPSTWALAPTPTISVREDAGTSDSRRVTLIWDDQTIHDQWLQVTVLATEHTGLGHPEVFYFGNAVGDSGDSTNNTFVDGTDFAGARDNGRDFLDQAPIDFPYDYNRDSFVDGTDMATARDNSTNFLTALKLITIPDDGGGGQMMSMTATSWDLDPAPGPASPVLKVEMNEVEAIGVGSGVLPSQLTVLGAVDVGLPEDEAVHVGSTCAIVESDNSLGGTSVDSTMMDETKSATGGTWQPRNLPAARLDICETVGNIAGLSSQLTLLHGINARWATDKVFHVGSGVGKLDNSFGSGLVEGSESATNEAAELKLAALSAVYESLGRGLYREILAPVVSNPYRQSQVAVDEDLLLELDDQLLEELAADMQSKRR